MCNGYEPVKASAKKITETDGQSEINQSQHESNDAVQMTNDETMFRPFVQCQSWMHFDHLPVHPQFSDYGAPRSSKWHGRKSKAGDFLRSNIAYRLFTAERMKSLAPILSPDR